LFESLKFRSLNSSQVMSFCACWRVGFAGLIFISLKANSLHFEKNWFLVIKLWVKSWAELRQTFQWTHAWGFPGSAARMGSVGIASKAWKTSAIRPHSPDIRSTAGM